MVLHEPRLYIQKQVAALDSRKCCDTVEYILRSSTKQREGVGETVVASGPLLEGDEPGAVGGSNTGPTVLHRLVGDGELAQVVSNHLRLHLNLCEDLAVVNANNGASHLGDDNHVPEVGLDHIGLLVGGSLLLLLPQLLDQGHGLPLESPRELPPDPADEQLHQLLVVHVKELVKVDPPVGELPEGPPLLQLDISVSHDCFCKSLVEVNQAIKARGKCSVGGSRSFVWMGSSRRC